MVAAELYGGLKSSVVCLGWLQASAWRRELYRCELWFSSDGSLSQSCVQSQPGRCPQSVHRLSSPSRWSPFSLRAPIFAPGSLPRLVLRTRLAWS